jgi:hypothetical protein
MGCEMRRSMLTGLMLLALAGCGKEEENASSELAETPQIASIEDYGLPEDKSDLITSIDAATGDARGMPRDGGAVITVKKQEERREAQAPEAGNATMAIPEVIAPTPPTTAPALTIPLGN